jgi:hypothetical protein
MNKDTLWLSENPDTGQVTLQLIYSEVGGYRTGWSRYLKDFYTEGWEWEEEELDTWASIPIGSKGLIQW